jgi:hypothetical protein
MNNINRQYYCFVAGLPELTSDQQKVAYTIRGFTDELKETLHPDDLYLVKWILFAFDNANLLNLLLKNTKPFITGGNLGLDYLEEAIKEPELMPEYLRMFVLEYKTAAGIEPSGGWENHLSALYFQHALKARNLFLVEWFRFNLQLNNILVAYTCRKFKLDAEAELLGGDEVVEIMKKSQSRDFGITPDVPFVDRVISILENKDMLERERGLDLMRWHFLDEQTTFHYFTVEVILSYLLKLMILDRWIKLDTVAGADRFGKISADLRQFEFSRDFQIHERNK